MSIEEARASIGKKVMSWDHGNYARKELNPQYDKPLGPYTLLQITKQGYAILGEGMERFRIRPSLLTVWEKHEYSD